MGQVANQTKSTLLFTFILVLIFFLLLPLQVRATQKEQGVSSSIESEVSDETVKVINSDDSGISFEVSPPELVRNVVKTENGDYEQIRIPKYDYIGIVGQPDLPQKGFLIALPPGAEPVLNLVSAENHQVANVKVAPTVKNTLLNNDGDPTAPDYAPEFEASYPFDSSIYDQNANYPANPVSLGQETTLRHQRAVWVIVNPVQVNPAQDTLTVYDQLQIEVSFVFPNGRPAIDSLEPESGAHVSLLQSNLLNYEQSLDWRTKSESSVLPETSPCMDPNAFRIGVKQPGMHTISYADLAAAYNNFPTSVPSAKLRMCYDNQQIRIKVNDGGDSNFNNGDSLVFYGQSIKTQETDTNIYWLTYSIAGSNGLRMNADTDSAAGAAPAHYIPTYHLETDTKYISLIPSSDLNDHWYWQDPIAAEPGLDELDVTFQMSNKASGAYNFIIRVELWGFTLNELHDFEVELNGTSIGTGQFNGSGVNDAFYLYEGNAPSTALQNGTNTITIIALDTDGDPNNTGHRMLVNWIEVEPRRQFVAQSNRLAFSEKAPGTYSFSIGSLSNGAIEIFDVTDPVNPTVQADTAVGGTVSFNRAIVAPAKYEVYATSAFLSPDSIIKDSIGSGLLGTVSNTADLIIITDPSLDTALTPLRNLRASQGLTVKTVFVQDIFDEFSYGRYATYGIKGFLDYAYNNWNGDLDYVLLAGDGSYDHRNVLGGNGNSNLVPVFLRSGIDSRLGEAASDNQYVDFNGDNLAEMMLGRIPAQTPSELTNMINKIIAYETGEANPSWRGRHLFVADNAYVPATCDIDPAGDFFATVNNFIANYFPDHILSRVYYAPTKCFPDNSGPYTTYEDYYATTSEIDSRIIAEYNLGNQFVIYTGHSGTQNWAGENIFSTSSVPGLNNGERTPILLPMTCLEGWYHFSGSASGLSEAQLKRVGGGAVASYAPTGFQVQTGHDFLIEGFYTAIFDNNAQTLGESVMQAKLNLVSAPSVYEDLHDTYMLLGDPAMQFNMPESVTQNFLPVSLK